MRWAGVSVAVDEYVDPERGEEDHQSAFDRIALCVNRSRSESGASQHPVSTLVSNMSEYLISEDDQIRARATLLLANVLATVDTEPSNGANLAPGAITHLAQFFSSRLEDYPSITPSLKALTSLVVRHPPVVTAGNSDGSDASATATSAQVTRTIFGKLHVSSLSQSIRQHTFTLIRSLLESEPHRPGMVSMGGELVVGFVDAMKGEKDPRCLLICLKVVRLLFQHFPSDADTNAEALFDVTGCYFPITFTPPPNDPYGITPEQLVEALQDVLCSRSSLIPHLVPLLLDKLASTVVVAKVQSLRLLCTCARRFGYSSSVAENPWAAEGTVRAIADALLNEVMHGQDTAVVDEALLAITTLASTLTRPMPAIVDTMVDLSTSSGKEAWEIFSDCLKLRASELTGGASMRARNSSRVLVALARGSTATFRAVLAASLPPLLDVIDSSSDPALRYTALTDTVQLVDAVDREVNSSDPPLKSHAEALVRVMLGQLERRDDDASIRDNDDQSSPTATRAMSMKIKRKAIEGLAKLIALPPSPIIAPDVTDTLLGHFTEHVLRFSASDDEADADDDPLVGMRQTCFECLENIARRRVSLADRVLESCVPRLMEALDDGEHGRRPRWALQVLTNLCKQPRLFRATVTQLVERAICFSDGNGVTSPRHRFRRSSNCSWAPGEFARTASFVSALADMMELNASDAGSLRFCTEACAASDGEETPSPPLVDMIIECLPPDSSKGVQLPILLEPSTRIIVSCIRSAAQSPDVQSRLLGRILDGVPLNMENDPAMPSSGLVPVVAGALGAYCCDHPLPASSFASPRVSCLLQIALCPHGAARSECLVDMDVDPVGSDSVNSAFAEYSAEMAEGDALSASQCLAVLANKLPDGEDLAHLLASVGSGCEAAVSSLIEAAEAKASSSASDDSVAASLRRAVCCLIWVAKAVIMRGRPSEAATRFAHNLRALVCSCPIGGGPSVNPLHDIVANETAAGFGVVLCDSESILTPTHPRTCHSSPFYRQRFFSQTFEHIIQHIRNAALPGCSPGLAPLLAVCHLAGGVPTSVLKPHVDHVFPVIVQALSLSCGKSLCRGEPSSHLAAITTFERLLQESLEAVIPHISTVVPLLLQLSCYRPSARVRVKALQSLLSLTKLPYARLHPLRVTVIKSLLRPLDDHKRAVRQQAVRVRNGWMVLQS